jgi:hypothetical protein
MAHAMCESREVCCCCFRMWGVKLPVLPRPGRDFYILVVSIRLNSACRVDGTQLDSWKKISIYILICVLRFFKFAGMFTVRKCFLVANISAIAVPRF